MKYVVVTGGVVSGLGKGITISSIGVLLKASGLRVTSIKIDPYLNSDAGTMSPFEHGEVYVLDDGGEADLDLGNYERFLDITLTRDHNITTGKVYGQVIRSERKGDYLGATVQVIPHVTNAIQDWISRVAARSVDRLTDTPPDICLVEVGGTVGDIESLVFLEALRQFRDRVGADNIVFLHVSLVPVIGVVGEQKTKPTQHSVKELRSVGISPDVLVCRSGEPLDESTRKKLGQFCQVPTEHVLAVNDVSNIYHVPLLLQQQNLTALLATRLKMDLPYPTPRLDAWRELANRVDNLVEPVNIALVGKYTGLQDSYLSVIKSLKHATIAANRKLVITWVEAAALEPASEKDTPDMYAEAWKAVRESDGILVPGGFGHRGVEGMILAIEFARKNRKPFFGICLGMQCAVLEYARNVVGIEGAMSTEFDDEADAPVIIFMPEITREEMGGTMRLGSRLTSIDSNVNGKPTIVADIYGHSTKAIAERHRHRYEVNPDYVEKIKAGGLLFTGTDTTKTRMEVVELPRDIHPFFFAVQYHPEFLSRPYRDEASPPFLAFIYAACGLAESKLPLPGRRILASASPSIYARSSEGGAAAGSGAGAGAGGSSRGSSGGSSGAEPKALDLGNGSADADLPSAADDGLADPPASKRRTLSTGSAPGSPVVAKLTSVGTPVPLTKVRIQSGDKDTSKHVGKRAKQASTKRLRGD